MPKTIRIRWPELDIQLTAHLLWDFNPYACEEFCKLLPAQSIQSHAVVAGGQMYAPLRFAPQRERCNFENMAAQPEGRLNMELDFQYFSLNYGPMTEAVPALALAQVVEEDLPRLREAGALVWENLLYGKEYLHVILEKGEEII